MKIVLAADNAGKPGLDVISAHLAGKADLEVNELDPAGYYADIADRAANAIARSEHEKGILFCGANKVPGIRAALTHDAYSAERVVKSNNAQIITMGARAIGPELAKTIVDAWLASAFDDKGPSAGNVEAIDKIDAKYAKSV